MFVLSYFKFNLPGYGVLFSLCYKNCFCLVVCKPVLYSRHDYEQWMATLLTGRTAGCGESALYCSFFAFLI